MLGFIEKALMTKIYSQVTGQIRSLFSRTTIDAATLAELETFSFAQIQEYKQPA